MANGRPPKVNIDLKDNHMGSKNLKDRQEATPLYDSQEFIPPKSLTPEELVIFNRLIRIFRETKNCQVSDADMDLIEIYCKSKALYDRADAEIRKDPRPMILVVTGSKELKGPNGPRTVPTTTSKPNPWYKIRKDEGALCLKYFDQLGLSPVARAKVGINVANAKKEEDIFAKLLERNDDD